MLRAGWREAAVPYDGHATLASTARQVRLHVAQYNVPARKLYEKARLPQCVAEGGSCAPFACVAKGSSACACLPSAAHVCDAEFARRLLLIVQSVALCVSPHPIRHPNTSSSSNASSNSSSDRPIRRPPSSVHTCCMRCARRVPPALAWIRSNGNQGTCGVAGWREPTCMDYRWSCVRTCATTVAFHIEQLLFAESYESAPRTNREPITAAPHAWRRVFLVVVVDVVGGGDGGGGRGGDGDGWWWWAAAVVVVVLATARPTTCWVTPSCGWPSNWMRRDDTTRRAPHGCWQLTA
jgi:hypothetical protein